MEKFYDKKNLGIPVLILNVIAYLTGYLLILKLEAGLIAAVIFAAIVFGLQFDDTVKSAVKQSYAIALLARLVYMGFDLLDYFNSLLSPPQYNLNNIFEDGLDGLKDFFAIGMYGPRLFQRILAGISFYGKLIVSIALGVVFFIFILQAFRGKELKFRFISVILGDIPRKAPAYKPPTAPQTPPMQNTYAQPQPQPQAPQAPAQPQPQAPQAPAQPQGPAEQRSEAAQVKYCHHCGKANSQNALFCASCGTKL